MRETTINYGYNELQYVEYMHIHTSHVEMETSKPRNKSAFVSEYSPRGLFSVELPLPCFCLD